jgi:hypothetical protein
LVNIVVVEDTRAAKDCGEVFVHVVGAPEDTLAALLLDMVDWCSSRGEGLSRLAVEPEGVDEVGDGTEEGAAVVETGAGQEVEALAETGLHVCEAYWACVC